LANLYHCEPGALRIGMPVRLVWERLDDRFNYPAFEPVVEP
jgi:uncharacterized OB-fold protein